MRDRKGRKNLSATIWNRWWAGAVPHRWWWISCSSLSRIWINKALYYICSSGRRRKLFGILPIPTQLPRVIKLPGAYAVYSCWKR